MRSALRSIGAVVAGFIVASLVMMIVEYLNGHFLHPDLGKAAQGMTDRKALRTLLATAPLDAFLVVIFGWIPGSVAGGWVAARLAPRAPTEHALALGALLTLAGVANNLMIPPPLWFWIASAPVFLPAAYLGARLSAAR